MTEQTNVSESCRYPTAYATGRELDVGMGQSCQHFSAMGSDPIETNFNDDKIIRCIILEL